MKKGIYIFLSIALFIPLLTRTPHARVIVWQVGDLDNSCRGFDSVSEEVITYQVPQDWSLRLGQENTNWEDFPATLYANGDSEHPPREIILEFPYPADYYNPILVIRASVPNPPQNVQNYLEVFKGDIFIGDKLLVALPFYAYSFPLGSIKKGINEKNRIIIKNRGAPESPLVLDTIYLYFDDTDTDGDGVTDVEEGACSLEQYIACIPLSSNDPRMIKRISLSVEQAKENGTCLRNVRFVDQNSLTIPVHPALNRYLPYGLIGFSIEEMASLNSISLWISFTDPFYTSLKTHAYKSSGQWDEVAFDFIDGNTIEVILDDGGMGDLREEKEGKIEAILALSYPLSLNENVEKRGCFINATIKPEKRI